MPTARLPGAATAVLARRRALARGAARAQSHPRPDMSPACGAGRDRWRYWLRPGLKLLLDQGPKVDQDHGEVGHRPHLSPLTLAGQKRFLLLPRHFESPRRPSA
jgi:hypothetical protein